MSEQPTLADDLTDSQYELCDAIEAVFEADPEVTWTPSALATRVGSTTDEARTVLRWLANHHSVLTSGNGAWTRYSHRPLHTPIH